MQTPAQAQCVALTKIFTMYSSHCAANRCRKGRASFFLPTLSLLELGLLCLSRTNFRTSAAMSIGFCQGTRSAASERPVRMRPRSSLFAPEARRVTRARRRPPLLMNIPARRCCREATAAMSFPERTAMSSPWLRDSARQGPILFVAQRRPQSALQLLAFG